MEVGRQRPAVPGELRENSHVAHRARVVSASHGPRHRGRAVRATAASRARTWRMAGDRASPHGGHRRSGSAPGPDRPGSAAAARFGGRRGRCRFERHRGRAARAPPHRPAQRAAYRAGSTASGAASREPSGPTCACRQSRSPSRHPAVQPGTARNAPVIGDDAAAGLGVDVHLLRRRLPVVTSLMTATVVVVAQAVRLLICSRPSDRGVASG